MSADSSDQMRRKRSSPRCVVTVSASKMVSYNKREARALAPWLATVISAILRRIKKPGSTIKMPPTTKIHTILPPIDATMAKNSKIKGKSATVPMVVAVKNSRTDENSRMAVNSAEGLRWAGPCFIPSSRSIKCDCTDSSIRLPVISIKADRASFNAPSMVTAKSAPSAKTHSVAWL